MKSCSLKLCFTAISFYTCRRDYFFRKLRQSYSNRAESGKVFSLLLSQFLQLRIDHVSRAGVQICFIIALPWQTSPIFFVHSALSSRPLSLFNHSSIHTFLLSFPVSTPLQPLSWWKILSIITCGVLHTLWLSLATLLSSSFFYSIPAFLSPLPEERAQDPEREDKKENRRQGTEKERTNMSWVRERIDVKDRWGEI